MLSTSDHNYQIFDLSVLPEGDRYKAYVLKSPAGEASTTFDFPFDEAEAESVRLWQTGKPTAGIFSPQALGELLFHSIFSAGVGECLRSSLAVASHGKSRSSD